MLCGKNNSLMGKWTTDEINSWSLSTRKDNETTRVLFPSGTAEWRRCHRQPFGVPLRDKQAYCMTQQLLGGEEMKMCIQL